jgi:hypothetical protein
MSAKGDPRVPIFSIFAMPFSTRFKTDGKAFSVRATAALQCHKQHLTGLGI